MSQNNHRRPAIAWCFLVVLLLLCGRVQAEGFRVLLREGLSDQESFTAFDGYASKGYLNVGESLSESGYYIYLGDYDTEDAAQKALASVASESKVAERVKFRVIPSSDEFPQGTGFIVVFGVEADARTADELRERLVQKEIPAVATKNAGSKFAVISEVYPDRAAAKALMDEAVKVRFYAARVHPVRATPPTPAPTASPAVTAAQTPAVVTATPAVEVEPTSAPRKTPKPKAADDEATTETADGGLPIPAIVGVGALLIVLIGVGVFIMKRKPTHTSGSSTAIPVRNTASTLPQKRTDGPKPFSSEAETPRDLPRPRKRPSDSSDRNVPIPGTIDPDNNLNLITPFRGVTEVQPAPNPTSWAEGERVYYSQDFNDEVLGGMPNGWSGQTPGSSLLVTEGGSGLGLGRCLHFRNDGQGTQGSALFFNRMPDVNGRIRVEFDIKCEQLDQLLIGLYLEQEGDFARSIQTEIIVRSNETMPTLRLCGESLPYEFGTWTHIKYLIDLEDHFVDVWVDQVFAFKKIKLRNPPAMLNTLAVRCNSKSFASLFLDNIRIVKVGK